MTPRSAREGCQHTRLDYRAGWLCADCEVPFVPANAHPMAEGRGGEVDDIIQRLMLRIHDQKSFEGLPETMPSNDTVPAKYWPIAWLREALHEAATLAPPASAQE